MSENRTVAPAQENGPIINQADLPFSVNLHRFVKRDGRSITELGEVMGISPETLRYLLAGERQPLLSTVNKIALGLGLPFMEWDILLASAGYLPYNMLLLLPIPDELRELILCYLDPKLNARRRRQIRATIRRTLEATKRELRAAKEHR